MEVDQYMKRKEMQLTNREEGRKEENILINDKLNTFYVPVIWRQTYGKGPF